MKLYLTNTTIIPNDGIYSCETATLEEVKIALLVAEQESMAVVSAIGHESTAKIMSDILGIDVPVNRIAIEMEDEDYMIALKLKQRPPEGKVLSKEEIEEIGYEFKIIERIY